MMVWRLAAKEVQTDRHQSSITKHNADRLAVLVRGLHGERVHDVLQDKSGTSHCVDVNLIIRSTHGIHIEISVPKRIEHVWPSRSLKETLVIRQSCGKGSKANGRKGKGGASGSAPPGRLMNCAHQERRHIFTAK